MLSSQVDDLSKTLAAARVASDGSNAALDDLTRRAETVAGRLELLMASMHDIADDEDETPLNAEPADEVAPEPGAPVFIRHGRNGSNP